MARAAELNSSETAQARTDRANIKFWNELCGSQLAKELGITDHSPKSLKKFDDWYFGFYPYLEKHIPFRALEGKRVLEIGPGYGTIAQRLAENGAIYHGLDIAPDPVAMVLERLDRLGVEADVRLGSILDCPFPEDYFDSVIAIGCLHHTGNLAKSIDKVQKVLKSGGEARMMVYNAASYRQWIAEPASTLLRVLRPSQPRRDFSNRPMNNAYDINSKGDAPPATEFVTAAELIALCATFSSCRIIRENIGADGPFRYVSRPTALRMFGPALGLDLYCCAKK